MEISKVTEVNQNQSASMSGQSFAADEMKRLTDFFSILISIDRRVTRQKGDVYEKPDNAE